MLATLLPWQKTLLDAAEIIKERGLRKGSFGMSGKPRCTLGAIREACNFPDNKSLYYVAAMALERSLPPERAIIADWNDDPATTAEDVIRALTEAALPSNTHPDGEVIR